MRLTTRSFVAGPISFLLFSATALAHNVDTALEIDVTRRVNCTRHALAGDTITVHYVGTLAFDGSVFDSSRNFGQPFTFTLGAGQVIKGWDEGLLGMCVGEQRKLTIPPSMGYGDRTVGPIPGGSTLSECYHFPGSKLYWWSSEHRLLVSDYEIPTLTFSL